MMNNEIIIKKVIFDDKDLIELKFTGESKDLISMVLICMQKSDTVAEIITSAANFYEIIEQEKKARLN